MVVSSSSHVKPVAAATVAAGEEADVHPSQLPITEARNPAEAWEDDGTTVVQSVPDYSPGAPDSSGTGDDGVSAAVPYSRVLSLESISPPRGFTVSYGPIPLRRNYATLVAEGTSPVRYTQMRDTVTTEGESYAREQETYEWQH
ncbi:hypothetical protein SLS62_003690 [Diatrype stigma]|uniref:Uncharacterized protein n=1 Tax=Diatrype stigma TaxID=117547 RepID=A0AAN9YTU2_9PEZI